MGGDRRTIIFVTHNVREAIRLGDRVVLLTFRPGRVEAGVLDRSAPASSIGRCPRRPRGPRDTRRTAEEINRSLEVEYSVGVKPHVVPGAEP